MQKILRLVAASSLLATGVAEANLLVNGDFETGDYTGWTTSVEAGSNGNLFVVPNNGGNAPVSGSAYALNATGARFFSITDQGGPGSYSLTQQFTVASQAVYVISFDHFANDQSGNVVANGRSYLTNPNQNATVDLLTGAANPFTEAAGDIVAVFYPQGADAGPNPNPWTSYSFQVTLNPGTYQIRFAETDNQLFFQQGVDNVSVTAVPEPATWAMMVGGFGLVGFGLRRRSRSAVTFA